MHFFFFLFPWGCCATWHLFKIPCAHITNDGLSVIGMGMKYSSGVIIRYKPDSRDCGQMQGPCLYDQPILGESWSQQNNNLVFIEWPEIHFLFILVMDCQLCPFSTTFLSPGEVLWCAELQISFSCRRWGGPFPSDSQILHDSRSLQAELRLLCLIFVMSYFYSCNPLWQVMWLWLRLILSLHPQTLPSRIKPSTQKHALRFQLPYTCSWDLPAVEGAHTQQRGHVIQACLPRDF